MFRLLVSYLDQLDQATVTSSDRRFFEVNLLNILGYRLPIDHCAECDAQLAEVPGESFAKRGAGLLCGACGRSGRTIKSATVALLRRAMQTGRFGVVRFLPDELAEAGELVDGAITAHLNRPLRSLAFLQEMARLEGGASDSGCGNNA
jgi:DNA repair protein RecO (recombination protein O)